jgi:hypothetical protein
MNNKCFANGQMKTGKNEDQKKCSGNLENEKWKKNWAGLVAEFLSNELPTTVKK